MTTEQKRYYIGNIHRSARHPGIVYACLFDREDTVGMPIISADIDYILDAAKDRYPGQVEGVIADKPARKLILACGCHRIDVLYGMGHYDGCPERNDSRFSR